MLLKAVKKVCGEIYHRDAQPKNKATTEVTEASAATKDEIINAFKSMNRGRTGEDGISVHLTMAVRSQQQNFQNISINVQKQKKISKIWNNAAIVLIHKKDTW